jgi:hypothetical protein
VASRQTPAYRATLLANLERNMARYTAQIAASGQQSTAASGTQPPSRQVKNARKQGGSGRLRAEEAAEMKKREKAARRIATAFRKRKSRRKKK